jgi:eukaryotic-like serine/threonine-protein kinase
VSRERFRRAAEEFGRLMDLPQAERGRALDDLRRVDEGLAREVEALLEHDRAEHFLNTPVLGARLDVWAQRTEGVVDEDLSGEQVGRYRLVRKVAIGGMGAVYLAERTEGDFRREVAVKLIRRGLDTDEVLRRFQHERQTLAALDHPGIARLLDGGATPGGRPYLVMEFVDGQPIDRYCREHGLDCGERIRLFEQVCEAVHFAHQNLVIHRDIKPQNVLVARDGRPKLVDFGVAKVLGAGAADSGLTVEAGTRFTPEYASPEQVMGQPVTTATDVYSLGVLLYELIAERPPYTLDTRTPEELRQRVCIQEPPLLGQINPEARGDVERIVAMAMRKEPGRRYATVRQFADDLKRHRRGLPVIARPPRLRYLAGKFVRRNRFAVVTAALVLAGAAVLVGLLVAQSREAAHQRDLAVAARDDAQAVTDFITTMLEQADPQHAGPGLTVRQFLDTSAVRAREELAGRAAVRAAVLYVMARTYLGLGLLDEADSLLSEVREHYEARAAADPGLLVDLLTHVATLRFQQRRFEEAEQALRGAHGLAVRHFGERSAKAGQILGSLGPVLRNMGRAEEAEEALTRALEILREAEPDSAEVAVTLNNLSFITFARRDLPASEALLREALEIRRRRLPPDHPMLIQATDNLAVILLNQRKLEEAQPLLDESLAAARRRYPPGHPTLSIHLNNSAGALILQGRHEEAERLARESFDIRLRTSGEMEIDSLNAASTLASALAGQGRIAEGEEVMLRFWDRVKDEPGTPLWRHLRMLMETFYSRARMPEKEQEFKNLAEPAP